MILENVTHSYTEIYVGGGNFITESYPTNFHTFVTSRPLAAGQTADDFREVTAAEREQMERIDALWVRPPQNVIDRWNTACIIYPAEFRKAKIGEYNENTGMFDIFKLSLNQEEAIQVLEAGRYWGSVQSAYCNNSDIRTNLPAHKMSQVSVVYPFYYCSNLEVANADGMTWRMGLYGCPKCHTINNLQDVSGSNIKLSDYSVLVNVTILALTKSLDLSNQPLITLESFQQIISKAKNTSTITITVHPEVYAKLVDETNSEWHRVMLDAAEKNIVFATT